jgi:cell division septum initiation protein DivIVA
MTSSDLQFWSLIAAVVIAALNIALIPLLKGAAKGQIEMLRSQFEKMIEVHNESKYAHPDMTLAARNEVDRVADNAQSSAAGVAKIAQEAAAGVAKTAQEAVAKVAADASEAVSKVRDGIEAQLEKMRGEIHGLREEFSAFRLEVVKSRMTQRSGRVRES